jgi:nucleoside-diphosphate-sugar epimerase
MIIGSGLLSSEFKKFSHVLSEYLIFASGVSDSKETNVDNFKREKDLLINTINNHENLKLIYFSSVLTEVIDNHYYRHKLEIENLIKDNSKNYIIFRVPQIVGQNGNKNNIVNFLKNSIKNESEILIYDGVYRSLIDIEDLINIIMYCIDKTNNSVIFLSGVEKITVMDLSIKIGNLLHKKPKIKKESSLLNLNWSSINDILIDESMEFLNIKKEDYNDKILKKYIK